MGTELKMSLEQRSSDKHKFDTPAESTVCVILAKGIELNQDKSLSRIQMNCIHS